MKQWRTIDSGLIILHFYQNNINPKHLNLVTYFFFAQIDILSICCACGHVIDTHTCDLKFKANSYSHVFSRSHFVTAFVGTDDVCISTLLRIAWFFPPSLTNKSMVKPFLIRMLVLDRSLRLRLSLS